MFRYSDRQMKTNRQTTFANFGQHLFNIQMLIVVLVCALKVNAQPVAPPDGLIGWWAGEGNALDGATGRLGVLENGATADTVGKAGKAFNLDGVDDYVNCGSSINLNDMTIMAWVFIDPTNNRGERRIISKDSINYPFERRLFFLKSSSPVITGDERPAFEVLGTGGTDHVGSQEPLTAGWHHLAGVRNTAGAMIALYVDGQMVASKENCSVTSAVDQPVPTVIGQVNPNYNSEFFSGLIDEVLLFDRALPSETIQSIYNAGSGSISPIFPTILVPPANQFVRVGSKAEFIVTASFPQPLAYQWQFNSVDLSGQTNPKLTLENVKPRQAGLYTVIVTTPKGISANASARLDFNYIELNMFAGVTVFGEPGQTFRIEYQNALPANEEWQTLKTITLQSGTETVVDYDSPNALKRFYRAVLAGP